MRKYKFDLNPFRDIIDANLAGFTKMCILHSVTIDSEDVDLVILNAESNFKSFVKFVKYIRETKRLHTMNGFLDVDKLYCFIRYILEANTELQRNERFLRLYQNVVTAALMEVDIQERKEELRIELDKISSYLAEFLDEDGNLIQED